MAGYGPRALLIMVLNLRVLNLRSNTRLTVLNLRVLNLRVNSQKVLNLRLTSGLILRKLPC